MPSWRAPTSFMVRSSQLQALAIKTLYSQPWAIPAQSKVLSQAGCSALILCGNSLFPGQEDGGSPPNLLSTRTTPTGSTFLVKRIVNQASGDIGPGAA